MNSAQRSPEERVSVVVTGLGLVTAAGEGVDAAWHTLNEGASALSALTLFNPGPYGLEIAGEAHRTPREPGLDLSLIHI